MNEEIAPSSWSQLLNFITDSTKNVAVSKAGAQRCFQSFTVSPQKIPHLKVLPAHKWRQFICNIMSSEVRKMDDCRAEDLLFSEPPAALGQACRNEQDTLVNPGSVRLPKHPTVCRRTEWPSLPCDIFFGGCPAAHSTCSIKVELEPHYQVRTTFDILHYIFTIRCVRPRCVALEEKFLDAVCVVSDTKYVM